jgi:hypothetical protein
MSVHNWFLLLLLLLTITGCSSDYWSISEQQYESSEVFLKHLMDGYDKEIPHLYCDDWEGGKSRIKRLLKGLGFSDYAFSYESKENGMFLKFTRFNFSSDPNDAGVLLVGAEGPPRIIRNPEKSRFYEKRIVTHKRADDQRYYEFYNGYIFDLKGVDVVWDEGQSYFCYGSEVGSYGGTNDDEATPTVIISVENPEISITSRLKRCPDKIIVAGDRLYIVAATYGNNKLPDLHFEVFNIDGEQLHYVNDFYREMPWRFARAGYRFGDYDNLTNSLIIFALREWPYSSVRYVYDIDNDILTKVTCKGYLNFINPAIFENSVHYIDFDKL